MTFIALLAIIACGAWYFSQLRGNLSGLILQIEPEKQRPKLLTDSTIEVIGSPAAPMDPNSPVEPALVRSSTISGSVAWRGTDVRVAGAIVVAYRSSLQAPDPLAYFQHGPNTSEWSSAKSDESGSFELTGLEQDRSYSLVAGGPGFVTPTIVEARSGDSAVRLNVARAYGALIQLNTSGRGAGDVPPSVSSSTRIRNTAKSSVAKVLVGPPLLRVLAGIPVDTLALAPQMSSIVMISDNVADKLGPCQVTIFAPNYPDTSTSYNVKRLDLGVEIVMVALIASSSALGKVIVKPRGLSPALSAILEAQPCDMELMLFANSREDRYGFRLAAGGAVELNDIPQGKYSVRIRSQDGFFAYSSGKIDDYSFEVQETSVLDLDLSGACAFKFKLSVQPMVWESLGIEITLADSVSQDSRGRTVYANARTATITRSAPYIAPCMEGTFILRLPLLNNPDGISSRQQAITVTGGEVALIEL